MASNSVSGSFKGIEISFTYEGPRVVMSVLNTTDEGKRLRVMFQQQPSSGRVNWTSFRLTGQVQEVVVPHDVLQSHKLAFYVDNHEPISTFTDKILDELKHIQEQYLNDEANNVSAPEEEQQSPMLTNDEKIDDLLKKTDFDVDPNLVASQNGNQPIEESESIEYDDSPNLELQNADQEIDESANAIDEVADESVNAVDEVAETIDAAKLIDESISVDRPKESEIGRKNSKIIENYVPDVSTELQFKIKVPSIPKSATKVQNNYIPSTTRPSASNGKEKNGFFGNLAGAFGLSFANKKQYFMEQNKQLYDRFHADLKKLEKDYNDGYGIPLENWDVATLNEQQSAVLLLNLMVNEVSEWKKEANKANSTKATLAKELESIEKELKQTLKHTRGINAPSPTLFPDRTASSDQDLENIQNDCDNYIKRFTEKLSALEQNHAEKVRVPAFKKFLLEFVRDKLFPSVAEFSKLKSVQTRLNWFLDLVDYELIPIEPGVTKFSPERHEVKDICSSDFEADTIVEVITPGLQLKGGKRIVQNAIVVQAE